MNPLGEAHICCLHTVVSHLYVTNTRFVEDPLTEGRQSTESHESKEQVLAKNRKRMDESHSVLPRKGRKRWLVDS